MAYKWLWYVLVENKMNFIMLMDNNFTFQTNSD